MCLCIYKVYIVCTYKVIFHLKSLMIRFYVLLAHGLQSVSGSNLQLIYECVL